MKRIIWEVWWEAHQKAFAFSLKKHADDFSRFIEMLDPDYGGNPEQVIFYDGDAVVRYD